jgi:hypothetical protein
MKNVRGLIIVGQSALKGLCLPINGFSHGRKVAADKAPVYADCFNFLAEHGYDTVLLRTDAHDARNFITAKAERSEPENKQLLEVWRSGVCKVIDRHRSITDDRIKNFIKRSSAEQVFVLSESVDHLSGMHQAHNTLSINTNSLLRAMLVIDNNHLCLAKTKPFSGYFSAHSQKSAMESYNQLLVAAGERRPNQAICYVDTKHDPKLTLKGNEELPFFEMAESLVQAVNSAEILEGTRKNKLLYEGVQKPGVNRYAMMLKHEKHGVGEDGEEGWKRSVRPSKEYSNGGRI